MTHALCRNLIARGLITVFATLVAAGSAGAGPVELLPGRWTGWGQMTMDGGETEKVKCIATYFSNEGGRKLRHNLRCASTNYTIDAKAQLSITGARVSGDWQERTYATGGAVTGEVIGDGISVNIVGQAFEASLEVETTKCRQKMDIRPKGMGVARIALDLDKC